MKKLVFILFFISIGLAGQSQCKSYEGRNQSWFTPEYESWMIEGKDGFLYIDGERGMSPVDYKRDTILADGTLSRIHTQSGYACYGHYPDHWGYVRLPDGVKLLLRCFAEYHYPTGMEPGVYNFLPPEWVEVTGIDDCGNPIVFANKWYASWKDRSANSPVSESEPESEPESSSSSCSITVGGRTISLYGRVQVVSSGADFKVEVRSQAADLRVKTVSCCARECGEWEFVSSAADFTIEYVSSAADLTIEFVSSAPGLR